MKWAGSPLNRTGHGSPQNYPFFKERYLIPRLVEGIFLRGQKIMRSNVCEAVEQSA
jgi:hypothetical protein